MDGEDAKSGSSQLSGVIMKKFNFFLSTFFLCILFQNVFGMETDLKLFEKFKLLHDGVSHKDSCEFNASCSSSDGRYCAVSNVCNVINLFNLQTKKCITFSPEEIDLEDDTMGNEIFFLRFTKDAKFLISVANKNGNSESDVTLYRVPDLSKIHSFQNSYRINRIDLSQDERYIALFFANSTCKIYDMKNFKEVFCQQRGCQLLQFYPPNTNCFALGLYKGVRSEVVLHNISDSTSCVIDSRNASILCLEFSEKGRYLAAGYSDGGFFVYDTVQKNICYSGKHEHGVAFLEFSKDEKFLAVADGSQYGITEVLEISQERIVRSFRNILGGGGQVEKICFNGDTLVMATLYDAAFLGVLSVFIKIFSVETEELIEVLEPFQGRLRFSVPVLSHLKYLRVTEEGRFVIACAEIEVGNKDQTVTMIYDMTKRALVHNNKLQDVDSNLLHASVDDSLNNMTIGIQKQTNDFLFSPLQVRTSSDCYYSVNSYKRNMQQSNCIQNELIKQAKKPERRNRFSDIAIITEDGESTEREPMSGSKRKREEYYPPQKKPKREPELFHH